MNSAKYVIGLDYGTDSARALVVDAGSGKEVSSAVCPYPRWTKGLYCNPSINQWRQHPQDYLDVMESSINEALSKCSRVVAENVIGIAFDTTGSTPVFVDGNATPLALLPEFSNNPNAMFILWKDHTSVKEAAEINTKCHNNEVDYTQYEGGIYSAEWYWAKALHVLRQDKAVAEKAYSIVECCEWLPAVLTGVEKTEDIVRSRCACGHKAMWNDKWGGLPPEEFLCKLDPCLAGFRERLFTETETADKPVGFLSEKWAEKLGLRKDVVVAGGAYDCHMGAVGAAIESNTLVRVIGTSTCDIMIAEKDEIGDRLIHGICGQVDGSVIPGKIGLEAGQSGFGDVYAMFCRLLEFPVKEIIPELLKDKLSEREIDSLVHGMRDKLFQHLTEEAEKVNIEDSSIIATDWVNGRRTPDANQLLKGTICGLTLGSTAPQIFRALVEATAFGTKAIVDRFIREGCRIDKVIGIGGIASKNSFVMQTMSDVLNLPIKVCKTEQACALGAAMFAAVAAGFYSKVEDASKAMNSGFLKEYTPNKANHEKYMSLYERYLKLGEFTEKEMFNE